MPLSFARLASMAIVVSAIGNAFAASPVPQDRSFDIPGIVVTHPPTIDGTITEGEWPAEARREGFTDKDTNLTSDEYAEFWIIYDEKYIYFAGRAKTDPKRVIRNEYRPNVGMSGNDNFGLQIDPFGGNSNFNSFQTNSNGATAISLAGGRAAKTEWLGEIEANGRLTETGWECEMRIPWSVMNLPPSGKRSPRFNVSWFRSNKSNTYSYRYIGQNNEMTPTWVDVMIPPVERGRTINLLPYTYIGAQEGGEPIANAGLDFKTSLTDTLQLVGTFNPDFRNVENSILSLDFSYFERLAGENRPFFNEGSQFLRTGYSTRLFASQRIPIFDAGFNVYGQLSDKTTVGALTTIDFSNRATGVVSANHRFDDKTSAELALVNNDQPGLNNTGGMANLFSRTGDYSYYATNQFTTDQVRGQGWRNNVGGSYQNANYEVSAEYLSITPDFFPRIGFNRESNLKGYIVSAQYEATPSRGALDAYSFSTSAVSYDYFTGGFYRNSMSWNAEARNKRGLSFGIGQEFSQFKGISDQNAGIGVAYPVTDPYRNASVNYSEGTFRGDKFQDYQFGATYRFFNRLQLSLRSQWQLSSDDQTQHIVGANWDIGKYESVGGRLVVLNGQSNWYVSYRLSGKRGTEYFLLVGDPRADSFTNRVILKAIVPVTIKY